MGSPANAVVFGSGQVGTYAAGALAHAGFAVHAADLRPDEGFFYRFGPPAATATLTGVDFRRAREVDLFLHRLPPCQVAVLCAGVSGESSLKSPSEARKLYHRTMKNVLGALARHEVERLILVSSLAVYGFAGAGARLAEDHPVAPPTAYGEMLYEIEGMMTAAAAPPQRLILRSAGVYGPKRFGTGSHSACLFERLLYAAALGDPIHLRGRWQDSDDYLYVKDLGQAIGLAASTPMAAGTRIFNVATGGVSTLEAVVAALRSVFPAADLQIEIVDDRLPQCRVPLDISRIRQAVGFEPRYSLAAGIADFASEVGLRRDG